MAQSHETTTDRLVGIIAHIKIERKSGQLTVKRGEGLTAEEGILTFIRGQITQANVGRRSGSDAVNWLSTWKRARYLFTTMVSDEELPIILAASSGQAGTNSSLPVARVNTDDLEAPNAVVRAYGVPYTIVNLSEASDRMKQAGLSRAHRHLYLLIDGIRSAVELVPLVGKSAEEVRNMLHDLEWLGIARIVDPPERSARNGIG